MPASLQTERLLLRQWRDDDYEPWAALNADPRVMEFYPKTLPKEESVDLGAWLRGRIAERGWGLWAAELRADGHFIGFIGLQQVPFQANFTPAVEVGWRLAHDAWGRGLATEGARACLDYAFDELQLDEVIAMTSTPNLRSMRVMEKIGMHRNPADDFDHPRIPLGHRLHRHVLYRISASDHYRPNSDAAYFSTGCIRFASTSGS
jgi:3-dehydroquinate dehydratase/shikimate dehydrogenase